jgi:16S rRNA (uracil1498-N3)-methyltransferase
MNLILFREEEILPTLPITDPRAQHLVQTLRRRPGDTFDAGLINGPSLKGTLLAIGTDFLHIDFQTGSSPPPLHPVALLIGVPRPQTARKILQEATSLGAEEIHFTRTEKGEPSYADSKLWATGEYHRHLIAGAEQAFTTRIPKVKQHPSLAAALDELQPGREAVALDNYEATAPLSGYRPNQDRCLIAIGSERGWSSAERDLLRSRHIPLLGLGRNVLRTETACLCALTLILAQQGRLG